MNKNKIEKFFSIAEKYLGFPYVWGGESPKTFFDCSGFIYWVMKKAKLGRAKRLTAQKIFYKLCYKIKNLEIERADFLFFEKTYKTNRRITHVGVYAGNGLILHCGSKNGVEYVDLKSSPPKKQFLLCRSSQNVLIKNRHLNSEVAFDYQSFLLGLSTLTTPLPSAILLFSLNQS